MLRLAVRCEDQCRIFDLPVAEALLGSSSDVGLRAPFRGVSRRHAVIRPHDLGVLVRDAGSKNGLMRDGKRYEEVVLRPGESVQLGQATLLLEEISTADAAIGIDLAAPSPGASDEHDTPLTASDPETVAGASPTAALGWARRHLPGGRTLTGADLEAARHALGARALLLLGSAAGSEGAAVLVQAGELPSREALAEIESRSARRARAGAEGSRTAQLAGGDLALLREAQDDAGLLLAALFPGSSGRPTAWQTDFFDYLADVVLPGSDGRDATPPDPRHAAGNELIFPPGFVAGASEAMRNLLAQVSATVVSQLDVLLLGETGTGKELFARMIHASGPTARGPFVAINCAAIPAELLEAQLFGVEGRIATGVDPRVGLFVKAEGGSIFLDEIGELPALMQAKLLRVLQEREVLPLGAHAPRKIRLRVISASNRDLERDVRHGRFRADLYYRLRGLQFHVPPLRDRRDDIPALVAHFVAQSAAEHGKRIAGVSRKALELLREYNWPGNVRELRIEIDRAVLVAQEGAGLTSEQFGGVRWNLERRDNPSGDVALPAVPQAVARPASAVQPPESQDLGAARDRLERQMIEEALRRTGGNQSRAAKLLGVTRNGLALKMKRLGLAAHPEQD